VRSWGRLIKRALENLYKKAIKMSEEKKDLLKLCIPDECHHWYRSLPSSKNKTDRIPEPQTDSESEEEF
jgi:hypothetical protein